MSNTERLVVLIVLVLVGLAFSLVMQPPALWLLAVVLVALVCVGTDHLIHLHWRIHIRHRRYAISLWIIPALLTLGGIFFLRMPLFASGLAIAIGLVVISVLLALVIVSEYRTIDPEDPLYGIARFILNIIGYLTVFALYTTIYGTKARSIMTATTITIVSALVALELLRGSEARLSRHWLYAGLCGLGMGEITWALNYWTISPLVGGIFLLLAFYAITGIVQNAFTSGLNRRVTAEFGAVTAIGLAFILLSMFLHRSA